MTDPEANPAYMKPEIEAAKSDRVFIGALGYLGSLHELNLNGIEQRRIAPLSLLFEYAREMIKNGGREPDLPEKMAGFFKNIPAAASWVTVTDEKHTIASTNYMWEIARGEGFTSQQQNWVLSTVIVHDCAYTPSKDFKSQRLTHMRDGETAFRKFAPEINKLYPYYYSDIDVEVICSIIRQHDNPSVKVNDKTLRFSYDPPPPKIQWALREADRLWMLDRGGFALDLVRKIVKDDPSYNPGEYLKYVISRHVEESEIYKYNELCFEYQRNKTLYRTPTGFNIFQRLVRERVREYGVVNG